MAEKTVILEIVTPEQLLFSGEVGSVVAPGTEGYFQVLHNHTPFLSSLQIGEIKARIDGKDEYFATSGGFFEVSRNKVSILAETAEKSSDIDIARAEAAKRRAEERLNQLPSGIDILRAEFSLIRSINRISIVGKR